MITHPSCPGLTRPTLDGGVKLGAPVSGTVAITADGRVLTHKTASTPHDHKPGHDGGSEARP